MTEFASRLTKVMHERGISQNGLAHVMGISQGTVSAWILKGSIPQPRVLWLLGKALDLSPNWLLTGEEYPPVRHTRPTRVEIELISELNPQANSKPPAAVVGQRPAPLLAKDPEVIALQERCQPQEPVPKQRAPRIGGLMADAKDLGVTYQHLGAVLHGKRKSKGLMERYRQLKIAQAAAL